ncbi:MAG: twin-arginine translocase subunit TatB, partial [Alphaproteobacteria bacterium]
MLDIAWSELLVVGIIAILVVGPKDLPRVMRTLGQWSSRMRAAAREFRRGLDEVVREAELEEWRKKADAARRAAVK